MLRSTGEYKSWTYWMSMPYTPTPFYVETFRNNPRPEVIIFFFHAQLSWERNLFCLWKIKYRQFKLSSCTAELSMKFVLIINIKMPTIVGILIFISRKNFMLNWVEYGKSFMTSELGPHISRVLSGFGGLQLRKLTKWSWPDIYMGKMSEDMLLSCGAAKTIY